MSSPCTEEQASIVLILKARAAGLRRAILSRFFVGDDRKRDRRDKLSVCACARFSCQTFVQTKWEKARKPQALGLQKSTEEQKADKRKQPYPEETEVQQDVINWSHLAVLY